MGKGGLILRRLRASILDVPTNFGWVYTGRLAASGFPSSREQLRWLAKRGINGILTLHERPIPAEWVNGTSIKVRQIPMNDHTPPSVDSLKEAVSYIEGELGAGRVLLVHCLAGKGRTGCVLAAYVMNKKGLTAAEAIDFVRSRRPGSIEWDQEKALYEYEKAVKETGKGR